MAQKLQKRDTHRMFEGEDRFLSLNSQDIALY